MADNIDDINNSSSSFLHRLTLTCYACLTHAKRRFIMSIRTIGPTLKLLYEQQLRVAELSSFAVLFCTDPQHLRNPNIEPRDCLTKNECSLTQHLYRNIVITLFHELYDKADKQLARTEFSRDILLSGNRGAHTPLSISGTGSYITHVRSCHGGWSNYYWKRGVAEIPHFRPQRAEPRT